MGADRRGHCGCESHQQSRGPSLEAHGDIIIPMTTASQRCVLAAVVLVSGACGSRPEPIEVAENIVTVHNQTSRDWRNVVITVNDHFRGGAPALAAHGRINAPLSQFRTGFGQRYDLGRHVFKVEVTATDSSGQPVRLEYGGDQRKR